MVGLAFAPGGKRLISASYDGEVRVTEIAGGALVARTTLPAALNRLALLPDGHLVLAGADGRVRVLAVDLSVAFEVEVADGPLSALAIAPDGSTIAVAGARAPVALLDVATRTVVRRFAGQGQAVWALAFSADGAEILAGGADGVLRRWRAASGEAIGRAPDAAVDAAREGTEEGARVFRACAVCHATRADAGPRAGPSLAGIMGRRIATAPGYAYSDAFKRMDIVWTAETIARLFEVGPAAYTPGTKMPEQRITDAADRRALVEWLAKVTRE